MADMSSSVVVDGDNGVEEVALGVDAPDALAAWLSVVRPIEAAQQRIETSLNEKHALCLTAYEVMECLSEQRGWTPMSTVCTSVGRSQPRLSRLVMQMEERGLVDRAKVDGDKRAFQINLTRKGRRTFQAASSTVASSLIQIAAQQDVAGAALRERLC